ncbi:MAG: hypothetical protein IPM06_17775 [Rhizobiales bacterium]|nr:hypothetical protein [Hyphomicrobiales bacterium]
MATIASSSLDPRPPSHTWSGCRWLAITEADTGAAFELSRFADRSVQVFGTFGAGGTLLIEGSNDGGTTWATLKDVFGVALQFTSADILTIGPIVRHIRPRVSAGTGVSLNVYLVEGTR